MMNNSATAENQGFCPSGSLNHGAAENGTNPENYKPQGNSITSNPNIINTENGATFENDKPQGSGNPSLTVTTVGDGEFQGSSPSDNQNLSVTEDETAADEQDPRGASSSSSPNLSVTEKGAKILALGVISKFRVRVPPETTVAAAKGVAKITKYANGIRRAVIPVAVTVDAIQVGVAVHEDRCRGTSRNTTEAVASVAGGWGFGIGGATAGAALGTAILPGVGTIIGGILGGLGGGIGGSWGAGAAAEAIGDARGYDMEERVCKKCKEKFKIRKYKGEETNQCPKCTLAATASA